MAASDYKKTEVLRPKLDKNISLDDYLNYYWLKTELISFCREMGISTEGWKLEIHERIVEYLTTKKIDKKSVNVSKPKSSKVSDITLQTMVNSGFKRNSQTTAFFKSVDSRFHYSVKLNQYIRDNVGKITYGDIINEWKKEYDEKKKGIKTTPPLPQCEYNQFVKDYLADNKDKGFKEAVAAWNVKKRMRGDNIYHREELSLYSKRDKQIIKEYHNGI